MLIVIIVFSNEHNANLFDVQRFSSKSHQEKAIPIHSHRLTILVKWSLPHLGFIVARATKSTEQLQHADRLRFGWEPLMDECSDKIVRLHNGDHHR